MPRNSHDVGATLSVHQHVGEPIRIPRHSLRPPLTEDSATRPAWHVDPLPAQSHQVCRQVELVFDPIQDGFRQSYRSSESLGALLINPLKDAGDRDVMIFAT